MIKKIPDFKDYFISNMGTIYSIAKRANRPKPKKMVKLSLCKHKSGHFSIYLRIDGKPYKRWVHRLVLETFVGKCPPKNECRHLDGNPSNNDVKNLAWGTKKENFQDRIKHGVMLRGENHPQSKLTSEQVIEIRKLATMANKNIRKIDKGGNYKEIAKKYNICASTIVQIVRGSSWKWLL